MSVARHQRPPELVDVPLEDIMQKYVGRFREKKPDWAAFEDAKIEGYKRAQHRFIGAGGSGKHGYPDVFVEDESGKRLTTRLGPWECISCPAGVIHGYQNDSLEPAYFQVMLGRGKPETMGYADEDLYKHRDAHLKAV